mgnify:CR=1 FL=1
MIICNVEKTFNKTNTWVTYVVFSDDYKYRTFSYPNLYSLLNEKLNPEILTEDYLEDSYRKIIPIAQFYSYNNLKNTHPELYI